MAASFLSLSTSIETLTVQALGADVQQYIYPHPGLAGVSVDVGKTTMRYLGAQGLLYCSASTGAARTTVIRDLLDQELLTTPGQVITSDDIKFEYCLIRTGSLRYQRIFADGAPIVAAIQFSCVLMQTNPNASGRWVDSA